MFLLLGPLLGSRVDLDCAVEAELAGQGAGVLCAGSALSGWGLNLGRRVLGEGKEWPWLNHEVGALGLFSQFLFSFQFPLPGRLLVLL